MLWKGGFHTFVVGRNGDDGDLSVIENGDGRGDDQGCRCGGQNAVLIQTFLSIYDEFYCEYGGD